MLPNFIIAGAPKAGTTSLYHYLCQHPDVFMCDPKEVNFFSGDEIEKQGLFYDDFKVKTLEAYETLFPNNIEAKAIGEGSVSYLFYPETPVKIQALLPDIKIIILLRNPLERGFSHYLMDYRLGLCKLGYDDIIFNKTNDVKRDLYYQQYVSLGLYTEQIKRYFKLFPRQNIRIYLQEDLNDNPVNIIQELYTFLDVDSNFIPDITEKHNAFSMPKNKFIHNIYALQPIRRFLGNIVPKPFKLLVLSIFFEKNKKPVLENTVKQQLAKIYNPDIEELEKLLGRDLPDWKIL